MKQSKTTANFKQLTILERITLSSIIPNEGNMKQMIVFEDIKKKIGFSQDDLNKYNINFKDNSISWNDAGQKAIFDFEFTEMEITEIKEILKKLDNQNKITTDMLSLCKIFGLI